jgi:hypothetical protein
MKYRLFLLLVLPFLILGLSACSTTLVSKEQPLKDDSVIFSNLQSVGQTFTSKFNGLTGITIFLDKIQDGDGEIILHLRKNPFEDADIRNSRLSIKEITKPGYYTFTFPALTGSSRADYYIQLELVGSGRLSTGSSGPDNYLDGSIYQNNQATNGQLTFWLNFNYLFLFTNLVKEGFVWLIWLLISIFLFVIPGWAVLSITWPNFGNLNWLMKFGLGSGVSLALYPVLMLFADLLHLKMGPIFAWLPMILGILILFWQNRRIAARLVTRLDRKEFITSFASPSRSNPWACVGILVLILLIFFVRFWAIRTIDVPMWGDSIQHTVMAQLIVDNKGLFNSWEPYAPYQSLTVQYGFSTYVALFSWITGLPSYTSALIIGQLINGFAIITLIPLAFRFSPRNLLAPVATLIFAGLLLPMPAYYVNWGRFAQLAGQAILPVAIWLTCEFLENNADTSQIIDQPLTTSKLASIRKNIFSKIGVRYFWMPGLIIGMVISGMLLTYYRTAFYFVCYFLAWITCYALPRKSQKPREFIFMGFQILVIIGASLVLFAPWLFQIKVSSLSGMVYSGMTNAKEQVSVLTESKTWGDIKSYLPYWFLILVVAAFLWAIIRKRWDVISLVMWVGFLQLYFMGQLIQLPGAIMLQVFAILIWLYMPASLLTGWLIGELDEKFLHHKFKLGRIVLILILICFTLYGTNKTRLISTPRNSSLVTRPDLRAMAWIEKETSSKAKFLVGSFRYNESDTAIGSDAGWWIPLLGKRQNSMPPQYALLFEVPKPPNQSRKINNLVLGLYTIPITSPDGLLLLCNNKITHIYFGQNQIYIGANARPLYNQKELLNDPNFNLLYHQDLVYIFSLNPSVCHQ